jgi:hypothetical protein
MYRNLIPLAVALVFAVGCGKKLKESDTGGGGGEGGGDTSATYTIKIREVQKGDKVRVVSSTKQTNTVTLGAQSNTTTSEESYEYVQTVLEMPAGAREPTKATREYKVAKATDPTGKMRDLSYAGKTVSIELKNGKYAFTAGGKPLTDLEAGRLALTFRKAEKSNKALLPQFLPKGPVKLNEPWTVDAAAVKELAGGDGAVFDPSSTITGKLTKAYTKNGKQWGTIEFTMNLVVTGLGPNKPPLSGTTTGSMVLDCAIDGSSFEGTETTKTSGDLKGNVPMGALTIKGGEESTNALSAVQ